mgnify:CR=1 FL=1
MPRCRNTWHQRRTFFTTSSRNEVESRWWIFTRLKRARCSKNNVEHVEEAKRRMQILARRHGLVNAVRRFSKPCVFSYFFKFFWSHASLSRLLFSACFFISRRGCNIIFDRQMYLIARNASKRLHETCKFSAYARVSSGFGKYISPFPETARFLLFPPVFHPHTLLLVSACLLTRVEDTTQSDKQIYFRRCFALRENRGLKKRETEGYYTTREGTQEHADSIFPGNWIPRRLCLKEALNQSPWIFITLHGTLSF